MTLLDHVTAPPDRLTAVGGFRIDKGVNRPYHALNHWHGAGGVLYSF